MRAFCLRPKTAHSPSSSISPTLFLVLLVWPIAFDAVLALFYGTSGEFFAAL
jgi:hypothetical protein